MDTWNCVTCLCLQTLVWDGYPELFPASLWAGIHCESVFVSLQHCEVFPMSAKQVEPISRSLGYIMIVCLNLPSIFQERPGDSPNEPHQVISKEEGRCP